MSAFGEKLPKPARWALNFLLFIVYWFVGGFITFELLAFYESFMNTQLDIIVINTILAVPFLIALLLVIFMSKKVLL